MEVDESGAHRDSVYFRCLPGRRFVVIVLATAVLGYEADRGDQVAMLVRSDTMEQRFLHFQTGGRYFSKICLMMSVADSARLVPKVKN